MSAPYKTWQCRTCGYLYDEAEGDAGEGQTEALAAGVAALQAAPVATAGERGAEIGHWSVRMAGELPGGG